ncbi:hypothetical protein I6F36_21170 [Bradyrhizobium sp. BRP19]|uniref:hypothetical protein n=1 Tax=Bradyrhizobium sp. BRP19 TaxID=2793823 RepID=UPI001CD42CC0|nr:hypothetical protein [Bradyrhizobium sp. BRP19]MCA1549345.1 hypothetical protein [Bradyrhizobium sp. BRP19]
MSRKPLERPKLGTGSERISVRLRRDQVKAIRKLSGPPPFRPSDSEIVRRLLDKALKATQR